MTLWSGLILVYGLLVAIGGIIGYVKARSKVSLMSGLGSGIALAISCLCHVAKSQSRTITRSNHRGIASSCL